MENHNYTYLDHNATTYLDKRVLKAMEPFLGELFANPSSISPVSQQVREKMESARQKMMSLIGATSGKLVFTGGGSESDNLAIKGTAWANQSRGKHMIISSIEHHAVLHTCEYLAKNGFEVSVIPVHQNGVIDMKAFEEAIRPDTILVSVMYANNETGVIQPVRDISKITKARKIIFHTDAVQVGGKLPIDVEELGVDLLTLSAHKFYGPKGVGCLYIRKGVKLEPLIHGGKQEMDLRGGTENVAGIIGMVTALELAMKSWQKEADRERKLRDDLQSKLLQVIPECFVNGDHADRLPNTLNIIAKYVEGESMLLSLGSKGIYASSGSACTSGSLDPSHVLLAMGVPHEFAHGSIRFSFGKWNTQDDVDRVVSALPPIVKQLRAMSPLWEEKS